MKKQKRQKVYALIDSQNLNLGVRSQGWTLDFRRFRTYLKDKYKVEKAFLFIGFIPKNKKLYKFLKDSNYELIFKPVLESKHPKVKTKGNVDAELVLHTMIQFLKFNKAIIVSGDGDFYCLVEYLVKKQKLGKLIVPNRHYSSLLRKYGKFIVNIDLMRKKLEKRK